MYRPTYKRRLYFRAMKQEQSRFTDRLVSRVPPHIPPLVERAAERSCCTGSEYMRRAIAVALRADGFHPSGGPAEMPPLAHSEQWQAAVYAKVEGDVIMGLTHPDHPPANLEGLRLVISVDEQTFDPSKHYRLKFPRCQQPG